MRRAFFWGLAWFLVAVGISYSLNVRGLAGLTVLFQALFTAWAFPVGGETVTSDQVTPRRSCFLVAGVPRHPRRGLGAGRGALSHQDAMTR